MALIEREVLDAAQIKMIIDGQELPKIVPPVKPDDGVQQVIKPTCNPDGPKAANGRRQRRAGVSSVGLQTRGGYKPPFIFCDGSCKRLVRSLSAGPSRACAVRTSRGTCFQRGDGTVSLVPAEMYRTLCIHAGDELSLGSG